ncbi:hypothetical protein L289_0566 [Acinetobacter gerneri DSM 14967 = CIP 107464 = MTCC 9824]|nr:hypothetical protein L289_0566 [Acinetobacter gerneri DSM 14967 = CIP 107464 = MTCC 9824]
MFGRKHPEKYFQDQRSFDNQILERMEIDVKLIKVMLLINF